MDMPELRSFLCCRGLSSWEEARALCEEEIAALTASCNKVHERVYGEDPDDYGGEGGELHAYICQERSYWGLRREWINEAIDSRIPFPKLRWERMLKFLAESEIRSWQEAVDISERHNEKDPTLWKKRKDFFLRQIRENTSFPKLRYPSEAHRYEDF